MGTQDFDILGLKTNKDNFNVYAIRSFGVKHVLI